jgi:hypothetical protein
MFNFKAYFWDNLVAINGQTYRNNEILTSYLNFTEDLDDYLTQLRKLKYLVQIEEGGDFAFCKSYNGHVQKAQELFYKIGGIVKTLPPYQSENKLSEPLLLDCLNKYCFWEDGLEKSFYETPEAMNEDFCNKFGYTIVDDLGNYRFYQLRFLPVQDELNTDDPNKVLMIHQANEDIRALFDEYIFIVEDIIRVQKAYSEFLDNYIHSKRKFLNDGEIAELFVRYLNDTEHRNSTMRICSPGYMRMSHEVYGNRLCEAYEFDTLGAFLYVDFFKGLERNHLPRRCDNCGRYFLLPAGLYSSYCEQPAENTPGKTCREVGSRKRYDDKCKTDPIWLAYNRAYKAHYARYMKKKMTTAQFEQWSRYAVELRDKAESGELAIEEYQQLLKV